MYNKTNIGTIHHNIWQFQTILDESIIVPNHNILHISFKIPCFYSSYNDSMWFSSLRQKMTQISIKWNVSSVFSNEHREEFGRIQEQISPTHEFSQTYQGPFIGMTMSFLTCHIFVFETNQSGHVKVQKNVKIVCCLLEEK